MEIKATGLPKTIEDYQVALNAAFAGGKAYGLAQRTWVGLTDEDKQRIHNETGASHSLICLVESAIEAAHGIKGEA